MVASVFSIIIEEKAFYLLFYLFVNYIFISGISRIDFEYFIINLPYITPLKGIKKSYLRTLNLRMYSLNSFKKIESLNVKYSGRCKSLTLNIVIPNVYTAVPNSFQIFTQSLIKIHENIVL